MDIRRVGAVGCGLAVAWALAGCSRPGPVQEPIRSVKLLTVQPGGLLAQEEYAAEVRARTESRLGFRVAGKLLSRPAEVGQLVRKGQLLATLDPQDLRLGAEAAQAQVQAARTQRDLAAADLKRFEELKAQGFVSGAEIDRRSATLSSAQAALDQATAQAALQSNQAAHTRLVADADGVVLSVEAEPGQVLAIGAPVLRLAHQGPREVHFSVPEQRVGALKPGLALEVKPWGQEGWVPARVREVAAAADPQGRTFGVRAVVEGGLQWPLGATATVRVRAPAGAASAALKLPTTALWRQGDDSAVWVFDATAGVVRARAVQVATIDGNEAVIAAGVQSGDRVVSAGVHVLTDGQKVVPYAPVAATPSR